MSKHAAVAAMAVLKVNWDEGKKDYLDTIAPLFVHVLGVAGSPLTEVEVRDAVAKEYGLQIPVTAAITILARCVKNRYVLRQLGKYVIIPGAYDQKQFVALADEQQRKLTKLVSELVKFCKEAHGVSTTPEAAEEALLEFLRDRDIEVIMNGGPGAGTVTSKVHDSRLPYLVAKFVETLRSKEPDLFRFLVDILVGQMLAHTIVYHGYENTPSMKLGGATIFLDVALLFNLFGINGPDAQSMTQELVEGYQKAGGQIRILRHTLEEFFVILENSAMWLGDRSSLDMRRASKALEYFVLHGKSASDARLLIIKVPSVLADLGIEIFEWKKDSIAQESVNEWQTAIERYYLDSTPVRFAAEASDRLSDKKPTILKDAYTLALISVLRKDQFPRSLKEAGYTLITANASIAALCLQKIRASHENSSVIPIALHDVYGGTLVWLQSPANLVHYNEKKLLSHAYAASKPTNAQYAKFFDQVEKLKADGQIGDDEYYLLRTSSVVINELQERTLGSVDAVTIKTAEEIIESIRDEGRKEVEVEVARETESHTETFIALMNSSKQLSESRVALTKIGTLVEKTVQFVLGLLFVIIAVGILFALVGLDADWPKPLPTWLKLVIIAVLFITGGVSQKQLVHIYEKMSRALAERIKQWLGIVR